MSEITTVSMPESLKKYADENDISISEVVQDELRERKQNEGGEEEQLREKKQKLESSVDYLEQELKQHKQELEELTERLNEIEEEKSQSVEDLVEAVQETLKTGIDPEHTVEDRNVTVRDVKEAKESCIEDRSIGLVDEDYSDRLKEFLDNNGFDPEAPLSDDIETRREAMASSRRISAPKSELG